LLQALRKLKIERISSEVSEKKVLRKKGTKTTANAAAAFVPTVT
jgi:hypothetical protein